MPPRLVRLHERVSQDTILVAADCSSAEIFKRFYLRSPDKGRGVCKGSTDCCPREHACFIFYFEDTDTFSVDDTPFLCGPLVFVISFVVRLVPIHI